MKKILLTLVAVFALTSVASAQTQWTLGGQVNFGSVKVDGSDAVSSYLIMPKATYNFDENWGVGLALGYGSAAEKTYTLYGQASLTYTVELAENFYYIPELFFGYKSYKGGENVDAVGTFSVGVDFGQFEYKPLDWMGITVNFGTIGFESTDGASSFMLGANPMHNGFNFTPTLGVRFHF